MSRKLWFVVFELLFIIALVGDLVSTDAVLSLPVREVLVSYIADDGSQGQYSIKYSGEELHLSASWLLTLILYTLVNVLLAWFPLRSVYGLVRCGFLGFAFYPVVNNLFVYFTF